MTYRHEVLFLNPKRGYVRVDNTWYDTIADFHLQVGEQFLLGKVEEVLSYDEYTNQYPESKNEMGAKVLEKTSHGGAVRKVSTRTDMTRFVEYAANPQQLVMNALLNDNDLAD